jgi:hypothetical protein
MNDLAGKQKRQLPRDVRFCRGVTTIEDLDEDNVVEVEVDDQDVSNNPAAEMIRRAEDVVADIPPEYDNDYVEDDLDGVSVRSTLSVIQSHQTVEPEINISDVPEAGESRGENVPDEVGAVDEVVSSIGSIEDALEPMSAALNPEPRYNLRPTRPQPGTWSSKSLSQRSFGLHMSTRAAIKAHGKEALAAMKKEIAQILEKETIKGVKFKDLTRPQRKRIIRSHMFFKEKYLPTGAFEKLKARFVAGGDGQDRTLYSKSQLSSKTVSTTSVFIVAALAAKEKRAVAVVDFPGAYLNSEMPKDGEKVHMKLDQYMTGVLVSMDPSHREFVNPDGTSIVHVVKGLYGLIEAAKLWYDKLSGLLTSLGFTANPYDPCVFNRSDDRGQTTLTVHVDDVMITAPAESDIDSLLTELEEHYSGLSVSRGKILNYLGMVLNFEADGVCKVTMDGFVEDLLSTCQDIKGLAKTPASVELFSVDEVSPMLGDMKRKEFHSLTAKLLYQAKRARPDLLTVVSFLTTRVQRPTEEDWSKLERAIRYVRGTKELGIRLEAGKLLTLIVYVDASFAVHPNMRSHSGIVVTLFRGPLYAKSSKQKLMTKSSTEAELVAISDAMGQAMWSKNFMEAQGYRLPPIKLLEDNMSTIALVKNGKSNSSRTRHIAIRYFFVSDKVEGKEIDIEYMPTESMLADILTKPLQGDHFRRLRDELLNVE